MSQLSMFNGPARKLRRPEEPILRSAIVEGAYRWELRRQWGTGPVLGIVGHNPSTADGETDDPTMWREMSFANSWGFGSLIKINIYPFRSSNPHDVTVWRGTDAFTGAFWRNIREATAALVECDTILAGWGNEASPDDVRAFVTEVERRLGGVAWMCMGVNANGSPRHALSRGRNRIPDDQKLEPWRVSA